MNTDISTHISYVEATRSDMAKRLNLDNTPNDTQLVCMKEVAEHIFEPLRTNFNTNIGISSFFRTKALNDAINGARTSQHMLGQAMDIDADIYGVITNKQIFDYIKDNLDFDQVIAENISADGTGGWVHCSYVSKEKNRHEKLTMKIKNGKQFYEIFRE